MTDVVPTSATGAGGSPADRLTVRLRCDPRFQLAFQQNAIPVVRELVVRNEGASDLGPLVVRLGSEPDVLVPLELRLESLPAGAELRLAPVDVRLRPEPLLALTERVRTLVRAEVLAGEERLAGAEVEAFLLPPDEWCGLESLPELLAAFVLPNDPAVMRVLDRAAVRLGERTGSSALEGYQRRSRRRVWEQVAALYAAVSELGIRYVQAPAGDQRTGQRVRFPGDVLDQRFGCCLDMALLFAACLEQAGLHPLVLLHEEHATVGCWLEERTLTEAATDDQQTIRKLVDLEELLVFEAMGALEGNALPLEQAARTARARLAPGIPFELALDVRRARSARILPLPLSGTRPPEPPAPGGAAPAAASESPALRELPAPAPAGPASRIDQWKSRLLDLSLRNRLVNFRPTVTTLRLLCPDPERVEDALASARPLQLLPLPRVLGAADPRDPALALERGEDDPRLQHLREELAAGRLFTELDPAEHQRRLTEVYRAARLAAEENGTNTLFVAVGILEWREAEDSERVLRAPLLLLPVECLRKSVLEGFALRRLDEDARVNVTLVELLRQRFKKEVPGLDPLPEDASGVDVEQVLRRFQDAVRDLAGWEVKKEVWLGPFSFTKFLLWKDLGDRLEALQRNRVVRRLVDPEAPAEPPPAPVPGDLDARARPGEVLCPRSADSSQLEAVLAAAAGEDFVLEGPPGTGKSQTITNLVAHALGLGKRVLFVAEKRAALDVVHRRLKEEGLEPFCLELHSNRAGKADVLAQFGAALAVPAAAPPTDWERHASELERVRGELNAYADALHRPRTPGPSAHDCLELLVVQREAPATPLALPSPLAVQPEALERLRGAALAVGERAAGFAALATHPLGPVRIDDWSPSWDARARALHERLREHLDAAERAACVLRTWLGLAGPAGGEAELQALAELASALGSRPPVRAPLLADPWAEVGPALDGWSGLVRERDALRAGLAAFDLAALRRLDLAALRADWRRSQAGGFLSRWLGRRRARRALAAVATDPRALDAAGLERALTGAPRLDEVLALLAAAAPAARARLGTSWGEGEPAAARLELVRSWAAGVARTLPTLDGGASEHLRARVGARVDETAAETPPPELEAYPQAWTALAAVRAEWEAALALDASALEASTDLLGDLRATAERIAGAWREIRPWCAWQRARGEARTLGLAALVEAVEDGTVPPAEAGAHLERSFRRQLLDAILEEDEVLRRFLGSEHDGRVRRFRALDEELRARTRVVLRARLAARASDLDGVPPAELALLRKELAKRARHLPVRALLGRIPTLFPRLKPCVLMSPLSVAQYLAPEHPPFDLVIFDEASQIPVWDAVGAIARGTQLVVVGDPKQLPPTSFFQRGEEEAGLDEGLLEAEDLESILDELSSLGLPARRLRWHYRSRHEGLIAFSNRRYYGGELVTFPAADPRRGGVHLRLVEGARYDRGDTRTNRAEAEALVAGLLERLRDPEGARRSYGVVTFSRPQQQLVENLLDEERRRDPAIEAHFGDAPPVEGEPVFVKNLENVQGDERDVILFSVCYGPDERGVVSMNFGPLNREGGERRLNVAITRAKHEVLVYSSLRGDQIDPARSRARGVQDLRHFLEYAERGTAVLAPAPVVGAGPAPAAGLARFLAQRLEAVGHAVRLGLGSSGTRIDLAVLDPDVPGRFLLGIECDGATYRRAASARDRDVLRAEVLAGLGWRLHRLWSPDCWHDPEGEWERLCAALAAARGPSTPSNDG